MLLFVHDVIKLLKKKVNRQVTFILIDCVLNARILNTYLSKGVSKRWAATRLRRIF